MTTFDNREKEFETRFKHDEEMKFKAEMRRNKLLGLWAAEQMGVSGEDAAAYAREVIEADFEEVGDEDVYRKVMGDLQAKNIEVSEHQLRRKMEELMAEARTQIMSEVPKD